MCVRCGMPFVNTNAVSAIRFFAHGPKVEVFTAHGGDRLNVTKGEFTAVGDEAVALWAWWVRQSVDLLEKPKPKPRRKAKGDVAAVDA